MSQLTSFSYFHSYFIICLVNLKKQKNTQSGIFAVQHVCNDSYAINIAQGKPAALTQ